MDRGDYFKSLLWFAEALATDQRLPAREEIDQMRIAAVLAQCPRLVQVISHDGQPLAGAVFSPTDDRLATIGLDRTARVWEIPSGRLLMATKPLPALPLALSFSPDGARLMVLVDNTVRLLDPATGAQLIDPLPHLAAGADNCLILPLFEPAGRRLVTQPKAKQLQIWDLATGKPIGARMVHTNDLQRVQLDATGTRLFTSARGHFAWDATTGAPAPFPLNGPAAVEDMFVSPKANLALVGRQLWRWTNAPSVRTVPHAAGSGARRQGRPIDEMSIDPHVAFSPEGERMLTISRDRTARLWDTATGEPLTPPLAYDRPVNRGSFSPDGCRLITMSDAYVARVLDAWIGQPLSPPIPHAAFADVANFSGSGRFFLTFHPAAVVCVWDLEREGAPPALLRVYGASGQDRAESGAPEGLSPPGNHTAGVVNVPADFTLRLRSINLKTAARQIWLDASARFVIVQGGMAQAQVWEASSGLPITPMVQSRFSLDEEACKQVRLPSAGLSAADAAELAQLLSGSRLDSKGGSATLKLDELLVAWERLRQKYPSLFQSTVDSPAWHRLEAEAAQAGRDWSAAAFHWQRLRAAQPANRQFVQRHQYALDCLAKAASAPSCAERRSVIPPRDPQAGSDLIDLTDYYTGPVTEGVQLGVQTLADVPFDVRGLVTLFGWHAELHGFHGRELVPGIRINRRGQRLHFLHTARWGYAAGAQPLAVVFVKYANGQVETINIRYQWEVGNDWFNGTTTAIRAQLACVGASPLCSSGDHCECLFKYTWPNPHPDWEISQLDLLSTKTAGSYVLVALTVQ